MATYKYCVAGIGMEITIDDERYWRHIASHYQPFVNNDIQPLVSIDITNEVPDIANSAYNPVYIQTEVEEGMVGTDFYQDDNGNSMFTIKCPYQNDINGTLYVNHECTHAYLVMGVIARSWYGISTITSGVQLSYLLATARHHRLMAHASCVVKDGKAYLFLGKSGTGKSTHSRMWLENLPDVLLLNDDHPIVSVADGKAIAYGSPWSGKTDCYVNAQAPIGGIIRIQRAPHNQLKKLSPIQAYASLVTSFSGMTFVPVMADARHHCIEGLLSRVPCYVIECLPNGDASRVCWQGVK